MGTCLNSTERFGLITLNAKRDMMTSGESFFGGWRAAVSLCGVQLSLAQHRACPLSFSVSLEVGVSTFEACQALPRSAGKATQYEGPI